MISSSFHLATFLEQLHHFIKSGFSISIISSNTSAHNIYSLSFRYAITKAFVVAFVMTFFSVFDVPVFWPILLCYWIVLFILTMKRQIMHMIKYKYVPFSIGKQVSIYC
jgi:hypothetical protein